MARSGAASARNLYYPALDGLRFLCCSAVVVGHTFIAHPLLPYAIGLARMGVDIFFSLSGFLITTLLLREKEAVEKVDLFRFYVRRTLRIWPVYYAAILIEARILDLKKRYSPVLESSEKVKAATLT